VADLRVDVVTALREQADTMVRVANDSPDVLGNPTAHAMVTLHTSTLRQLADRIERLASDQEATDGQS
jgi:hypothetical protein